MARISKCSACGRSTCDEDIHAECHLAQLGDLLEKVKRHLKKFPGRPLPAKLAKEIISRSYPTMEALEKSRSEETRRATRKQLHDLLKFEAVQKASREFEAVNPDSDPQTY